MNVSYTSAVNLTPSLSVEKTECTRSLITKAVLYDLLTLTDRFLSPQHSSACISEMYKAVAHSSD